MAVIFWFSTDRFSGSNTSSILEQLLRAFGVVLQPETLSLVHVLVRKLAHLTAYAVLALLLYRAVRSGSTMQWQLKWAVSAFLISAAYALLDEYHQSLSTQRIASVGDSLLDMIGSLGALAWRRISSSSQPVRIGGTGQEK